MATVAAKPAERLLTIQEYLNLVPGRLPTELVRGRVITLNPPYPWHGYVCNNVAYLLKQFATEHDLGSVVCNDSGVLTGQDPDTLRGADVAFYSFRQVPREKLKQRGYLSVAPELVVEVKSPDDRWKDILAKVAEYLNAGVCVVWVVDPERSTVTVYQPDQPEETLTAEQTLTIPNVLPGFTVQVARFFE